MDEDFTLKRIIEMGKRSYQSGTFSFSDFLTVDQQDEVEKSKREFTGVPFSFFGGADLCERRMVRFGDENFCGYQEEWPISCIKITPASEKFAKEYTHKDYLGALMSLGLERKIFGDIFIDGKGAYVFCVSKMADYVCENLISVGRNNVSCEITEVAIELNEGKKEKIVVQVNSPRVDAVIAHVYHISRGDTLPLFTQKKVVLNGHTLENNDKLLKEGDIISCRGFGKFLVGEEGNLSKKGKINLTLYKYV